MKEKTDNKPQRGLWYERPLGTVRGFLKEPDVPPFDPEADEERKAIQKEGCGNGSGESETN
jgi:hypothetical protein